MQTSGGVLEEVPTTQNPGVDLDMYSMWYRVQSSTTSRNGHFEFSSLMPSPCGARNEH